MDRHSTARNPERAPAGSGVYRFLRWLIRLWLTAPIIEADEHGRTTASRPRRGTPQGGVIAPPTTLQKRP